MFWQVILWRRNCFCPSATNHAFQFKIWRTVTSGLSGSKLLLQPIHDAVLNLCLSFITRAFPKKGRYSKVDNVWRALRGWLPQRERHATPCNSRRENKSDRRQVRYEGDSAQTIAFSNSNEWSWLARRSWPYSSNSSWFFGNGLHANVDNDPSSQRQSG